MKKNMRHKEAKTQHIIYFQNKLKVYNQLFLRMSEVSREFQVFVKPVGASCNLACKYCYYLSKRKLYEDKSHFLMSDEILEKYVVQHIMTTTESIINYSWHGGEPLLAGIDFFRKAVEFQKKHLPAGKVIFNAVQTNGTLLDDEWCSFLASEGFIVGMSIDGPGELHDKLRSAKDKSPTSEKVIGGYNLLRKYGIIPEVLCVVNAENVTHPLAVYNFFRELGAKYISFLPLVEFDIDSPERVSKNSVPSKEFGIFLSAVFDEWVEKDIGEIKIQVFEEAARSAFNQDHTLCIFKVNCGGVPVVEHNGDFYTCDHFVDDDHLLGNIKDHTLTFFLDSDAQKAFGEAKSSTLPKYCVKCEVRSMCNGECPKNRFMTSPEGEPGLNYLCSGYKYFFNHCNPFVKAIAEAWENSV
jgi:uncharacterized protein